MRRFRRAGAAASAALVLALAGVALVATPAQADDHHLTLDGGSVVMVQGSYEGVTIGSSTTKLHVTLPPEAIAMGVERLSFRFGNGGDPGDDWIHTIGAPTATFDILIGADFFSSLPLPQYELMIYNSGLDGNPDFSTPLRLQLTVKLDMQGAGSPTVNLDLSKANATSQPDGDTGFHVSRAYEVTESGDSKVNWGDTVTIDAPAGFWNGGPEAWADSDLATWMTSANFDPITGAQFKLTGTVSGDALTLTLPAAGPATADWGSGTSVQVTQVGYYSSGDFQLGSNTIVFGLNFYPTSRIAGANRFATAAAVSAEFATAGTAYIANGRNYPDALSAAPAAAHAHGPLLLVEQGSLPQETADELLRLQPAHIIIAGGTAAVSDAVKAQLEALYPGTQVKRIAGANRYDTSRQLSEDAFGSAANAFVATGLNFPDALAASAAAAHIGAPVILVDGTASTVDAATKTTFSHLGTTEVYIAGGTGAVSAGIETQLVGLFTDPKVKRLSGSGRYETAVAINDGIFTDPVAKAYLAVGTGYADALAGAALAGSNDAPLYTTPSTCVPQATLDSMSSKGATDITLFGGTAVLNLSVAKLVHC